MYRAQSCANLQAMKRPFEVTVLGWLFIFVGIVASAYHLWNDPFDRWTILLVLVRVAALVGGLFLLRGASWARWLLLTWLALHVAISALDSLSFALPHIVLLLVVGYVLLGPPTRKYFQRASAQ
jgi:hypothetical protein